MKNERRATKLAQRVARLHRTTVPQAKEKTRVAQERINALHQALVDAVRDLHCAHHHEAATIETVRVARREAIVARNEAALERESRRIELTKIRETEGTDAWLKALTHRELGRLLRTDRGTPKHPSMFLVAGDEMARRQMLRKQRLSATHEEMLRRDAALKAFRASHGLD